MLPSLHLVSSKYYVYIFISLSSYQVLFQIIYILFSIFSLYFNLYCFLVFCSLIGYWELTNSFSYHMFMFTTLCICYFFLEVKIYYLDFGERTFCCKTYYDFFFSLHNLHTPSCLLFIYILLNISLYFHTQEFSLCFFFSSTSVLPLHFVFLISILFMWRDICAFSVNKLSKNISKISEGTNV